MGILQVFDDDDVMVMSDQGNLVRLPVGDIRPTGRNTQGVRLINLRADQRLVGAVRIEEDGEDDVDETDDAGDGGPLLPGISNGASA